MNSKAIIAILLAVVLAGVGAFVVLSNNNQSDGKVVCVTMPWQKEIVDGVSQNTLKVKQMIGPGADPHVGEMKPSALIESSNAIAYFWVGSGIEWEKKNIPVIEKELEDLKMVKTAEGITLLDGHHHHEGEGAEGEEHATDPHVWTSPNNLRIMAESVRKAMVELDPESKETYEKGFKEYSEKLDVLDALVTEKLRGLEGEIMVWHGAWKYLFNDYADKESNGHPAIEEFALQDIPEIEKATDVNMIKLIKEKAEEHNIKFLYYRPMDGKIAGKDKAFNEIGITLVLANPLSHTISEEIKNFVTHIGDNPPEGHGHP